MAPKATADEGKTARADSETVKKKTAGRAKPQKETPDAADGAAGEKAPRLTQDDVIRNYQRVYDKCMEGETKSFDAKGALNALDQISKIMGLDAPSKEADAEANRVTLTLSDKVGDRGD